MNRVVAAVLGVLRGLLVPTLSIICGFAVAGVAVYLSNADPIEAFTALFQGAFILHNALPETLVAAVPYIFLGLAVATGFKAGLFNIGADGQFYVGALAGVYCGYSIQGLPAVIHIPIALGAGVLVGGAYGVIPGVLKARFGAHEVITTIMLNHIAYGLSEFLINGGPMRDPHASAPRTPFITPDAQLPILLPDSRLHLGLVLALLAVPLIWFLIERTVIGFRLRAVGLNPVAARAAGISVGWTIVLVMGISGGLAGLAGSDEVLGLAHFMPPSFSIGYGLDAIAVALVAKSNPWAVLPSALLFGALRHGAAFMQFQTQVSADLISVVEATVIIFVAAPALVRWLFRIRERSAVPASFAAQEGV
ncbi:MAG TPA: ABC transporter permease [Candidatus Dormibacteraeota bacterium]